MPRNHDSQKPKEEINPIKLDTSDEMIAERRGGSGPMPKDMPRWMALTITKIDLANKYIGNVVCWITCLLYTSPSPRDAHESRMPSSA